MKHIVAGFKLVFFVGLFMACVSTVLLVITVIATVCGDYVAYGVFMALLLFILGVVNSYDGG